MTEENWRYYFRDWELSEDKKYYTVTEKSWHSFNKGDKVVVICHGMNNFEVLPYEETHD